MFSQMVGFPSFHGLVIYCYLHIDILLFIYSSIKGHLDCFHILTTVNNAAVNMGVQVSFQGSKTHMVTIVNNIISYS